ncbi:MAG: hypothetical protein L0312_09585, partial [Acidobacteria bacterium]|nr:hypothetical protein [Acidobacteriota bacterium]
RLRRGGRWRSQCRGGATGRREKLHSSVWFYRGAYSIRTARTMILGATSDRRRCATAVAARHFPLLISV